MRSCTEEDWRMVIREEEKEEVKEEEIALFIKKIEIQFKTV